MYFVAKESIVNPETQKPVLVVGAVFRQATIDKLWHQFGVDTIDCYACFTRDAAESMSKRVANSLMFKG